METGLNLYMIMLGCKLKGRLTEQHDVFFGIGNSLKELVPEINAFWPEAAGKFHIDAWRTVTMVDGYQISIGEKTLQTRLEQLFFLNLGGYMPNEFEEYHYKMLRVANNIEDAINSAKKTTFFKHYGFKGAVSHIDDKHGIDVDDIHKISEILPATMKANYSIVISKSNSVEEDPIHLGYLTISKL